MPLYMLGVVLIKPPGHWNVCAIGSYNIVGFLDKLTLKVVNYVVLKSETAACICDLIRRLSATTQAESIHLLGVIRNNRHFVICVDR